MRILALAVALICSSCATVTPVAPDIAGEQIAASAVLRSLSFTNGVSSRSEDELCSQSIDPSCLAPTAIAGAQRWSRECSGEMSPKTQDEIARSIVDRIMQSAEPVTQDTTRWVALANLDRTLSGRVLAEWMQQRSDTTDCSRRLALLYWSAAISSVRFASTNELLQQISTQGLRSIVDDEHLGSSFFYTVQHSDHDPQFQRRILAELVLLGPEHRAYRRQFASLVDRLLRADTGKQRYGTIATCQNGVGVLSVPLESPEGVGSLRAALGLSALEEQLRVVCDAMRSGSERVVRSN